jgi:dephospho-CoA kinase
VGLVGGVGSGKSTLTRRAAERFGFAVIDGDAAGHRALANDDVNTQLKSRFGTAVISPSGEINRSALAKLVFGDKPEHAAAKSDLERITHPLIRQEFHQRIKTARSEGVPAVLLDAAVLIEAGWQDFCDVIAFIDVPATIRLARIADRGWTEAEWRRREASQLPLDEKRRRANIIVSNSGSLDQAVDALVAAVGETCGESFVERTAVAASTA